MTPQARARTAGFFYLLSFVAGVYALFFKGGLAAGFIAAAFYVVVTLLFYGLFKPVSKGLSMLAAFFSLLGCAIGVLGDLHLNPIHINSLVFFGFYCLLIGYLIFKSTFLPKILGLGMAIGGLGWLTFLFPAFANQLSPYNVAPGMLGEGALTLWLLIAGVNAERWKQQAGTYFNTTT